MENLSFADLRGLPWTGGKSVSAKGGTGRWVKSLLPDRVTAYVEPFAGMLGVLLQRKPVAAEIANDLNELLINWWRVVADQTLCGQMAERLELTPTTSEWHFVKAYEVLREWEMGDEPDGDAAYWWTIITMKHIAANADLENIANSSNMRVTTETGPKRLINQRRLRALYHRMRDVQLINRDAVAVIRMFTRLDNALIYVDPPYPSAPNYYGDRQIDPAEMAAALSESKGWVAISGQEGDEWEKYLGGRWWISEHPVLRSLAGINKVNRVVKEQLWTNYDPEMVRSLPQLFPPDQTD